MPDGKPADDDLTVEFAWGDADPTSSIPTDSWATQSVLEDDGGNLSPEEEWLAAQWTDGGPEDSSAWTAPEPGRLQER